MGAAPHRLLRIGAFLDAANNYFREVVTGFSQSAHARGRWELAAETYQFTSEDDLCPGRLDAVIFDAEQFARPRATIDRILNCGLPAVAVSPGPQPSLPARVPQVLPDDVAVGRACARELLDRGIERIYFSGVAALYSSRRESGARQEMAGAGFELQSVTLLIDDFAQALREGQIRELAHWLRTLPTPAGVIAVADWRAHTILLACREAGVRVPEDVALVSVDDHPLCQLVVPALSSVPLDGRRAGQEAASLLSRLLAGEPDVPSCVLVAPRPIVARASTDVTAVPDPEVATALRFIAQRCSEPITVNDVADAVTVGERSLQMRFRRLRGHTVQAELAHARVNKAKRLLAETDLLMPSIARACGFRNAERLSVTFHRVAGVTPTAYRARYRMQV